MSQLCALQPFQRFQVFREESKPVETVGGNIVALITRLKPGENEKQPPVAAPRLIGSELPPQVVPTRSQQA